LSASNNFSTLAHVALVIGTRQIERLAVPGDGSGKVFVLGVGCGKDVTVF